MRKLILCVWASLLLLSCSKNNNNSNTNPNNNTNPTPNNPTTNTTIDEAKLKNKWELISYYTLVWDTAGKLIDSNGVSQTYHDHGVGNWDASFNSYMTFNADNSYDHSNADGTDGSLLLETFLPRHGKWTLKGGNKVLSLETLPGWNGTTNLDYDVVDFNDHHLLLLYKDTYYTNATPHYYMEFKR